MGKQTYKCEVKHMDKPPKFVGTVFKFPLVQWKFCFKKSCKIEKTANFAKDYPVFHYQSACLFPESIMISTGGLTWEKEKRNWLLREQYR